MVNAGEWQMGPDMSSKESLPTKTSLRKKEGTWVAQSVEHLTLDFGSGHDLTVGGIEHCNRLCANSAQPAWDSLSLPLSAPPLLALSLKIST